MPKYVQRSFQLTGDYGQVPADRLKPIFVGRDNLEKQTITAASAIRNRARGVHATGQRFRSPSVINQTSTRMREAACWNVALCAGTTQMPPGVPKPSDIIESLHVIPVMTGANPDIPINWIPTSINPGHIRDTQNDRVLITPSAQTELIRLFTAARRDPIDPHDRWTDNQKAYHKRLIEIIVELCGFSIRDFHLFGDKYEILCNSHKWWGWDHWGIRRTSDTQERYLQSVPGVDVYVGGTSLWDEGLELTAVKISRVPQCVITRLSTLRI